VGADFRENRGEASQGLGGHPLQEVDVGLDRELLQIPEALDARLGELHDLGAAVGGQLRAFHQAGADQALHHAATGRLAQGQALGELGDGLGAVAVDAMQGVQLAEGEFPALEGVGHALEHMEVDQAVDQVEGPAQLGQLVLGFIGLGDTNASMHYMPPCM